MGDAIAIMKQASLQVLLLAALAHVATTAFAGACMYPSSGSSGQKKTYFACLRSVCQDTSGGTVTLLSGGAEASCTGAVAGSWACDADLSRTVVGVPGSTLKDMCPATCNACATAAPVTSTALTSTSHTKFLSTTVTTTTIAACTYPSSGGVSEKETYFACLRAACEDTSYGTVTMLSGGAETSCSGAVAGSWSCDTDISGSVIKVPGSTVKDMCPATCNTCATATTVTSTATAVTTTSLAEACTYPGGGSIGEKETYFACLRAACEDTSYGTVTMLSGGAETSCRGAVAGSWSCDTDISRSVIKVPGSTVKDMCPATCNACATATTVTSTTSAVTTTSAVEACTYPSGGSIGEKETYFACLRAACEDTSYATVTILSGGAETSCRGAVAGSWTCDADISKTVIKVPGSTVKDMCPATCNACVITATITPSTPWMSKGTSSFLSTALVVMALLTLILQ